VKSTKRWTSFGQKLSTRLAMPSTGCIIVDCSKRLHTNTSPVTNLMYNILESLGANVTFWLRNVEILSSLLKW
jgi:uncharacterized membrane protein